MSLTPALALCVAVAGLASGGDPAGRPAPAPGERADTVPVPGGAATPSFSVPASASERLHGRVTTRDGEVWEGTLRWDRNEAAWIDVLDATRPLPEAFLADAEAAGFVQRSERERSVEFMGVRVIWEEDEAWPEASESGIRFGHLATIRILDPWTAVLTLRSGEEIEVEAGTTDVGRANRGIEVVDPERGRVTLAWEEVARVDLGSSRGATAEAEVRLHGTVRDRWGGSWTGYVAWDLDEVLAGDVLDGREEGETVEIPFHRIAVLEREGPDTTRVELRSGEVRRLTGTNDVDRGNRGVQVSDPSLGVVTVPWDAFADLRLHPPAHPTTRADFDGGRRLRGVVETRDGRRHEGAIRWDADESWSWEMLDGRNRGMEVAVEMGSIHRVVRRTSRTAEVHLRDGRMLVLRGSSDVGRENRGIYVETEGGVVAVDWLDLEAATFQAPPGEDPAEGPGFPGGPGGR